MSINASKPNSLSSDAILNKAVIQILGGHQDAALARLAKCGLFSAQQVTKIKTTLAGMGPVLTHYTTKPHALKERILEALNLDVKEAQVLPKDNPSHLCFTETTTCEFANAYPCKIEFGGKIYSNGAACFLAQQYTDQPHIMDLLSQCETAQDALFLSSTCPMTKERKLSWENPDAQHINKNDIMMHVLRAKFGQNPELKEKLLKASGIYIVAQGNDPHWSDCFNGTGQNQLGLSLMCLQGEYGGIGIVEPSRSYNKLTLDLKNRCQFAMFNLGEDFIFEIFKYSFSEDKCTGLRLLACTNKHFYKHITKLVDIEFEKTCSGITIIDAKKQGFEVDDEPPVKKLALIKRSQDMVLQVEDNAGITLLTMKKGLTLNELVAIAEKAGIKVGVNRDQILIELGDVPVEHTYRILITNNVFINSRDKTYDKQCELVVEFGCEMPTVQEYVVLCIFTSKIFNICLYGRNPMTNGRSSTRVGGHPLVVGGSAPGRLNVYDDYWDPEPDGAGGRRKF